MSAYNIPSSRSSTVCSFDDYERNSLKDLANASEFPNRNQDLELDSTTKLDRAITNIELEQDSKLERYISGNVLGTEKTGRLVTFTETDKLNPQNWSMLRKCSILAVLASTTLASTFASSSPSAAIAEIAADVHLTSWQVTLTNSCFLLGFAFGPLCIAPISELNGRRNVFLVSGFGFTLFNLLCGFSNTLGMLGTFRFLAGTFASTPVKLSGAVMVDIFSASQRGNAMAIFSLAPFLGPALGPIVAGFVTADLSWRWVYYVCACFSGVCTIALFFIYRESLPSVILTEKARKLRTMTGDLSYYAAAEKLPRSFHYIISVYLARPLKLLIFEPIVTLISIYMAIVYGILYMFFVCYPLIFEGVHGFRSSIASLAFIPFALGSTFALCIAPLWNGKWRRDMAKFSIEHPGKINPEARLPMTCLTGPMIVGSLLLLGWTGYQERIHWIVPMLAGFPFGAALLWTFSGFFSYLADTYLSYTASAMAANALLRSLFGFGFPLFARKMYEDLHIEWASTLLAGLALLMTPVPFIFWKMGAQIRGRSGYAT